MTPPPLLTARAVVVDVAAPSKRRRLVRIGGDELRPILQAHRPADAVRIDLTDEQGGERHRVYTLRDADPEAGTATLDVVLDSAGVGARWAEHAVVGDEVLVHGSRYGYDVDPKASAFVLVGDDSAHPAIIEICRQVQAGVEVTVLSVADDADHLDPISTQAELTHLVLADVATACAVLDGLAPFADGTRFWCAGEAGLVKAVRRRLRNDHGVERAVARFAIYWRSGLRLEETAPMEDAERQLVADHGIVLDDLHDHNDIEPSVDLAPATD